MRLHPRAASILCCVVLAACTGTKAADTASPSAPSRDRAGGTLTVGLAGGLYFALDPQNEWDFSSWELFRCCLLRTLMSYTAETGAGGTTPRPDLAATSPDVSLDGMTWTFHLRTGLRYAPPLQDVPITSTDIVRAIMRAGDPSESGNHNLGDLYLPVIDGFTEFAAGKADSISGLETPDAMTLRVHEVRPDATLPYVFSMAMTAPIPPRPNDAAARYGVATGHPRSSDPASQGGYGRYLVSSGPYMLEGADTIDFSQAPDAQANAPGLQPWSFDHHYGPKAYGSVTLVRNPSWDPATDPLRAALPDRIMVEGGRDGALFKRFSAGSLAMVYNEAPPRTMLDRYLGDPSLRPFVQTLDSDNITMGTFNLAQPPFDDVAVRKAVAYALDRRPLATEAGPSFGFGDSVVASHYINDAAEGALTAGWDPFPGPHGAPDLAAARSAMSASRYADGTSRCVAEPCSAATVLVDDRFEKQVPAIRMALAALGVHGAVRATGDLYGECGATSIRAGLCIGDTWFPDIPSAGNTLLSIFGSPRLTGLGPQLSHMGATPSELAAQGWPVVHVPDVDAQIQRCNQESGTGQIPCWARFDQYLVTQLMPAVPIAWMRILVLSSPAITTFTWDQATGVPALGDIAVAAT